MNGESIPIHTPRELCPEVVRAGFVWVVMNCIFLTAAGLTTHWIYKYFTALQVFSPFLFGSVQGERGVELEEGEIFS